MDEIGVVVPALRFASARTPGAAPPKPASLLSKALHFADEYTSPRPDTAGNLPSASYFQAAFNGAADGFYVFGLPGIVAGAGAAAIGVAVQNATHSQALGVACGAAVGAVAGIVLGGRFGSNLAGAIGGAVLGGYETLRGDPLATHRDSATLIGAVFLRGPAKMACSLGSMIGASGKSTTSKILIGGAIGAGVGAAIAAAIPGPASILTAAVVSGIGGAIGPFLGPRQSQLLRNLSADVGKAMTAIGKKIGIEPSEKPKSRLAAVLGTVPVSFAREGIHAFLFSDGSMSAVILGGLKESARQIHIVLTHKDEKRKTTQASATPSTAAANNGMKPQVGSIRPHEAGLIRT